MYKKLDGDMNMESESKTVRDQKKIFRRELSGDAVRIEVEIRWDDHCGNGHNTFAITGTFTDKNGGRSCGCIHDTIREYYPELAKYIQWHLWSPEGGLHMIENAVYMAGDRDCWGYQPGDVTKSSYAVFFDSVPIPHYIDKRTYNFIQTHDKPFMLQRIDGRDDCKPRYCIEGMDCKWHTAPFKTYEHANGFCLALNNCQHRFEVVPLERSKGKERELDAARSVANWPDATDEELSVPSSMLEEKLLERLPGQLEQFRKDVEELGFTW